MAEMLVRNVDKGETILGTANPAPELLAMRTQRGDVITVQPDGWPWSPAERAGDPWHIVKVPGVSVEQLSAFAAQNDGDEAAGLLTQRRHFYFDLDAWDGTPLLLEQALAHKRKREDRQHPRYLGAPRARVLG